MIEGKLRESKGEPLSVQVVCVEAEPGLIYLRDDSGVFLKADPYQKEDVHPEDATVDSGDKRKVSHSDTGSENEEDLMTLEQALEENAELKVELSRLEEKLADVREDLATKTKEAEGLGEELGQRPTTERVDELQEELRREKDRMKGMWRTNCEQLTYYDQELFAKDEEIAELKKGAAAAGGAGTGTEPATTVLVTRSTPSPISPSHTTPTCPPVHPAPRSVPNSASAPPRRLGKAPPADMFTGENPELCLEDWFPMLECVSAWNGWSPEELLIQFAGHLCG